jgi:hypothetical protein
MIRALYILNVILCHGRKNGAREEALVTGFRASIAQDPMPINASNGTASNGTASQGTASNVNASKEAGQSGDAGASGESGDEWNSCRKLIRMDTDIEDTSKFSPDAMKTWLTYSCPSTEKTDLLRSRDPRNGAFCDPCMPQGAVRYGEYPASSWYCTPTSITGTANANGSNASDSHSTPYLLCAPSTPREQQLLCADGHWTMQMTEGGPVCSAQLRKLQALLRSEPAENANSTPANSNPSLTIGTKLAAVSKRLRDPDPEEMEKKEAEAEAKAEEEAAAKAAAAAKKKDNATNATNATIATIATNATEQSFAENECYYWVGYDLTHEGPVASEAQGGANSSSYSWEPLPTPKPTVPPDPKAKEKAEAEAKAKAEEEAAAKAAAAAKKKDNATNATNATPATTT